MIIERTIELARGRGERTVSFYYQNTPNGVLWFADFTKSTVWYANMLKREWLKQGYYCAGIIDLDDPESIADLEYIEHILPTQDWE